MARGAPECRVCGFPHWSYQPHKLVGGPEPSKDVKRLARMTAGPNPTKIIEGRVDPMTKGEPIRVQPVAVDLATAFDGIGPLTAESARSLTDSLKADFEYVMGRADAIGRALELAERRQAWKALGYSSWSAYVDAEFEVSRRQANRLISHERFMLALAPPPADVRDPAASEADTSGTSLAHRLTEGQTRAVRDDPKKAEKVKRAVAQGVPPAEAVKRATSRTKDPVTGEKCGHPRTVQVTVCADCGRRVE